MQCDDDRVLIRRGANAWVIARTDRDAATAQEVRETIGAFLARVLGRASPVAQRSIFETLAVPGSGDSRWVIGAARPVRLVALAQPSSAADAMALFRPEGELIAMHTDCPTARTLDASRPWIAAVDFDWRSSDVRIPWPTRKVVAGIAVDSSTALDWLLLGAAWGGSAREKDTTFADEVGDAAGDAAGGVIRRATAVVPLVLLAGGAVAVAVAASKGGKCE